MERRTKLGLLILFALLLLGLGLYLIFQPFISERFGSAPAAPNQAVPYIPPSLPVIPTEGTTGGVTTPVPDDLRALENRSRTVVERIGSGTSGNGFLGYQDVLTQFTSNGRASILAEQKTLQEQHPASGASYGISTRAAAARLASGASGAEQIVILVEAVQVIDAGDPSKPQSSVGKRADLTFVRQPDGQYLIESIAWSDLEL